jgi:phosphoenolpyruvate synthase/pyruvate phosphate dikinase
MMCEVPSNCDPAEQFLEHFDGMSIGSNDLTQLTLGLDRDSGTGAAGTRLRRARPGREGDDLARDRGLPRGRQVHRASAARGRATTRLRGLAGAGGDRVDLAEPGHGVETWSGGKR